MDGESSRGENERSSLSKEYEEIVRRILQPFLQYVDKLIGVLDKMRNMSINLGNYVTELDKMSSKDVALVKNSLTSLLSSAIDVTEVLREIATGLRDATVLSLLIPIGFVIVKLPISQDEKDRLISEVQSELAAYMDRLAKALDVHPKKLDYIT